MKLKPPDVKFTDYAKLGQVDDSHAEDKEASGMMNEADCLYCALKHVSVAYALWNEFMGAPQYKLEFIMSLGELRAAELHLVQKYPDLCVAVRELRLGIENGDKLFNEFRRLMVAMADIAGIFEVDDENQNRM